MSAEPQPPAALPQQHDPLGGGGSRIISRPLAAPPPTPTADAQLRAASLHYCVAQGYVEDVQRLLRAAAGAGGGGVDAIAAPLEEGGETLLHVAADAGAEAIAALLLGAGAPVDAREGLAGRTPLHYALAQGHWGTAGLLLEAGADPRARDAGGLDAGGVLAEAAGAGEGSGGGGGGAPPPALLDRLLAAPPPAQL